MKRVLLFLSILLSFMGFAWAQNPVDPLSLPKLTQYVTDFSNTLTASQIDELNAAAKDYEDETSNQVVAVLFPTRNGNELIDIGMKLFEDNGIGQKDKNNWLLLLIATQEKKIRIIVGYGLEGVYPDLMASQVIENDIRPLVNSGDIAAAIRVFYERSKQIIWGEIPLGYTDPADIPDESNMYLAVFLWFLLGVWLKRFGKWYYKTLSKQIKKILAIWLSLFFLFAFLVGIYFVGTFLLWLFFGIIFGIAGIFPGFLGRWGSGGWFGWWGFSWWGGSSWGGGAGD